MQGVYNYQCPSSIIESVLSMRILLGNKKAISVEDLKKMTLTNIKYVRKKTLYEL